MKISRRRILIAVLCFILLLIILRGPIYRLAVSYQTRIERPDYAIADSGLIRLFDEGSSETGSDIREIIQHTLAISSSHLSYTTENNHNDPNKLFHSKTAHCVGYAAFFASGCNYLLHKKGLGDWQAKSYAGELYLFGENIHRYFKSPFFRDHDFVILSNKKTGEQLAVDPTLHDYLRISKVRSQ